MYISVTGLLSDFKLERSSAASKVAPSSVSSCLALLRAKQLLVLSTVKPDPVTFVTRQCRTSPQNAHTVGW